MNQTLVLELVLIQTLMVVTNDSERSRSKPIHANKSRIQRQKQMFISN